ncbi:MAG: iron ABC transporter permease [Fibromonadaceae bacterium]|jgi:iron complex transport system permease protein|nr:iron ABC transporter permease [Fibromonadaceae bacterium]
MSLRFSILATLLLTAFLLTIFSGSAEIAAVEIVKILLNPAPETMAAEWRIIWDFRLPRALAATLAGAALSLSGLLLQSVFRNPLAGPYVLGISSGASLGIALFLLAGLGVGSLGFLSAAALGAMAVLAFIALFSKFIRGNAGLLVLGLMAGYFADAVVSILMHGTNSEALRGFISWGFGSFGRLRWEELPYFVICVLLGLIISIFCIKYLNAIALGDEGAKSLGINVKQKRLLSLLAAAVLAAVATAFCGPIGFIGMATPHLARGFFNSDNQRILIPASLLMGALLALVAGLLSQGLWGMRPLPLNAVASLMGAPVVIWVLLPRKNRN